MIFSVCVHAVFVAERIPGQAHRTAHQGSAGAALCCAQPREGANSMKGSHATTGMMPEGGVRPVQRSSRGDQPLLRVTAAAWCCSAMGDGRETGRIGEKERDGTAQRTLGQGVWEGNSVLAKKKVNTKYLIGIFLLLNSLSKAGLFSLIHSLFLSLLGLSLLCFPSRSLTLAHNKEALF